MFCSFIVNKISSESLGILSATFEPVGLEKVSSKEVTQLETVKSADSPAFHIINQDYTTPSSFTFQIVNKDFSDITQVQEREYTRVFCKRGVYVPFEIFEDRYIDLVFMVNISNPRLVKVGRIYGMEFDVVCKFPFAQTRITKKTFNTSNINQKIKLNIVHDNDDYLYPSLVIIPSVTGNLTISNDRDTRIFSVSNVTSGEVITIDGNIPTIKTNLSTHNIWSAFNKNWIRFVDGENTLTINNPCNIVFTYQEARKVGV